MQVCIIYQHENVKLITSVINLIVKSNCKCMNSNLFKLGCNIWVHIAMYIIMQRFIFIEKKITEYCACIYMDFFRLQNLLNLHIYKCHIYLTYSVVFVWGLFTYF